MTPSPEAHASQPLTAFEAYERVCQSIRDWQEDAVVVLISLGSDVDPGGKSQGWGFTIESSSLMRRTKISWVDGDIRKGFPDIIGGEVDIYSPREGLPLDEMIDSNEAVQIAAKVLDSSDDADEPLIDIRTERFDIVSHSVISPSWRLTYGDPDDIYHQWIIIINALTGKVLRNDFNPPPPTPTPIRQPVPDQLALYTYGDFDLMVANAQGLSLGIEPDSGKHVAEIPDAWQDLNPGIITEDSVRVTAAVLINPLEGRYRLHLHGPGEQEKQCRLSVQVRKGTGEEVLREVEIPCQGGVSLVYEFTLSLFGEELLSDVVPSRE